MISPSFVNTRRYAATHALLPPSGQHGARRIGIVCVVLLLACVDARGQVSRRPENLQIGIGAVEGVGLQAGYVLAGDVFTREATVQTELTPRFSSNREALRVTGGVGGSVRIIHTLETVMLIEPTVWDVHLGARFGPSLLFSADETELEKNRRFSLYLEPFVRVSLGRRRTYYFEVALQRPYLRVGFWFAF